MCGGGLVTSSSSWDSVLIVGLQQLNEGQDTGADNAQKKNGSELPPRLPIVHWKVVRAFPIHFLNELAQRGS